MAILYCFKKAYIKKMLNKCKESDLAVIDTDGISTAAIKVACARGFMVTSTQEMG